jgi:hypothetical protein
VVGHDLRIDRAIEVPGQHALFLGAGIGHGKALLIALSMPDAGAIANLRALRDGV